MNFSRSCRSCMKDADQCENNFNPEIVKMFTFCTNVAIPDSEDQLPRQFCSQCTSSIQSCFTFISTARDVNQRLNAMINCVTVKIEIVPDIDFDRDSQESDDHNHESLQVKQELPPNDSFHEFDQDLKLKVQLEEKSDRLKSNMTNESFHEFDQDLKLKVQLEEESDRLKSNMTNESFHEFDQDLKLKVQLEEESDRLKSNMTNESFHEFDQDLKLKVQLEEESDRLKSNMTNESFHEFDQDSKIKVQLEEESDRLKSNMTKETQEETTPNNNESEMKNRPKKKLAQHQDGLINCPQCDRKFKKRRHLNLHVRWHRETEQITKDKVYVCAHCSRVFKRKHSLGLHMHTHDNTLKNWACDVCGSKFSYRQALLYHQRVHTGEKPYQCKVCDYSTAYRGNIRSHERAHKGERAHVCSECGKAFKEKCALKRHMLWHTGERLYRCPYCGNMYRSSGNRRKHMIKGHKMDPSLIPRLAKDGGPARRYVTEDVINRGPHSLLTDRAKNAQECTENGTTSTKPD